jgi:hypothetical protein
VLAVILGECVFGLVPRFGVELGGTVFRFQVVFFGWVLQIDEPARAEDVREVPFAAPELDGGCVDCDVDLQVWGVLLGMGV